MSSFMKTPCNNCPYRQDVKPFLHPSRGEDLAIAVQNRYNTFACHKTLEHDEDDGETFEGEKTKVCAGFLSLQHNMNGSTCYDSDGFEPSDKVYYDSDDMIDAYYEQDQ